MFDKELLRGFEDSWMLVLCCLLTRNDLQKGDFWCVIEGRFPKIFGEAFEFA